MAGKRVMDSNHRVDVPVLWTSELHPNLTSVSIPASNEAAATKNGVDQSCIHAVYKLSLIHI